MSVVVISKDLDLGVPWTSGVPVTKTRRTVVHYCPLVDRQGQSRSESWPHPRTTFDLPKEMWPTAPCRNRWGRIKACAWKLRCLGNRALWETLVHIPVFAPYLTSDNFQNVLCGGRRGSGQHLKLPAQHPLYILGEASPDHRSCLVQGWGLLSRSWKLLPGQDNFLL